MLQLAGIDHAPDSAMADGEPLGGLLECEQLVIGWVLGLRVHRLAQCVQWADGAAAAAVEDVGVDHGGLNICVAEQFLHGADVVSAFQQVCGKAVAHGMGRCGCGWSLWPTSMRPWMKRLP